MRRGRMYEVLLCVGGCVYVLKMYGRMNGSAGLGGWVDGWMEEINRVQYSRRRQVMRGEGWVRVERAIGRRVAKQSAECRME